MFKESQKHPLDVLDKPKKPKPPPVQQEDPADKLSLTELVESLSNVFDDPYKGFKSINPFGEFDYSVYNPPSRNTSRNKPKTSRPSKSRPSWLSRLFRTKKK